MIRTSWFPNALARPISRRRTLPYTRKRRVAISHRPKAAAPSADAHTEDMIFDRPMELPPAQVISRDRRTQLAADLRAWFAARWQWFKPRTIPMIVAFVGLLLVMGAANWLRAYAVAMPAPTAKLQITVGPPGAVVVVDRK